MQKETKIEAILREQIREERLRQTEKTVADICNAVTRGDAVSAAGNLLFHTPCETFRYKLDSVLEELPALWEESDSSIKAHILGFLTKLSIDLGSFLPNWHLKKGISDSDLEDAASSVLRFLEKLESTSPNAKNALVRNVQADTIARLKAEGVEKGVEAEAKQLMGNSMSEYARNMCSALSESNLMDVAKARIQGSTATELGNDYAVFLQYFIWLGGSFVTTNPVLIKVAWDTDVERWNERVDALIGSKYGADDIAKLTSGNGGDGGEELLEAITTINSLVTMNVVEENCRLLRDIFLITDGNQGYVSLQVNPKNHADAAGMVTEAKRIYEDLHRRFDGVPNVVFKLPATSAGLQAAENLTSEGIGVTITVSFAVFQAVEFARVLSRGHALVTYIALMNGRMAFPVRDELKRLGVENGEEAARWAGVEVARKSYHRLYDSVEQGGLGIDPSRVCLLIASLRIYGDWLPDISELWGCPVITIFPNVRRKYDSHNRELDGSSVLGDTPDRDMKTMMESEIFRQAWWIQGDPENKCPKKILTLADKDKKDLAVWEPVANTLNQFVDLYDQMGEMVLGRIKHLSSEHKGD